MKTKDAIRTMIQGLPSRGSTLQTPLPTW